MTNVSIRLESPADAKPGSLIARRRESAQSVGTEEDRLSNGLLRLRAKLREAEEILAQPAQIVPSADMLDRIDPLEQVCASFWKALLEPAIERTRAEVIQAHREVEYCQQSLDNAMEKHHELVERLQTDRNPLTDQPLTEAERRIILLELVELGGEPEGE